MSKLVRKPATLFSMVLAVVLIPVAIKLARVNAAAYVTAAPLTPSALAPTMIRAGLSPEALTAVGVTANSVSSIVSAFDSALLTEPERLPAADAAYAEAKTESDRLRRLIQSGRGTQANVTAYKAEMDELETALAARASALDAFFSAATKELTLTRTATLGRMHSNRNWEVPIQFKTVDRTEGDWVNLRKALANERICAKYGDDTDPALMSFLATSKANGSVSAAKASLDTNLALVKAAWESAVHAQ